MQFVTKYKFIGIGVLIGGLLGFAYYHFIGCATGTCAITSKPLNSTIYGMIMGYLMVSPFQSNKKKKND